MDRLRPVPPGDLSAEQRALYDHIISGPRSSGPQHFALTAEDGSLRGPFNAMLLSPALGSALQQVGAAIRFESSLPPRSREMAILIVAAHWDSAFERHAHERLGRAAGLTDQEIDQLRAGRTPVLDDPNETACINLVRAMLTGDIDDQTWADSAATVGPATTFELSTLVGYYSTLALQLRVFRAE